MIKKKYGIDNSENTVKSVKNENDDNFFFNFRKAGKVTAQTEAKKCQIFEVTLN